MLPFSQGEREQRVVEQAQCEADARDARPAQETRKSAEFDNFTAN
jgi:hypothetical protein